MNCSFCIKICTKCKRILVAYNGNYRNKKGGKYGLHSICHKCENENSNKYYNNHKEQKKCYQKERSKKYYQEHKYDFKQYNKKYYEKNKDEKKKYRKKYYEENKERCKRASELYALENPDKIFNQKQKRRQLEESQGNGISKEQWLEMMNFFDWKCAYSGIVLDKNNRSIDHIVPLSKGGEHEVWNLVPMLKSYNSSKYISNMLDWYIQQDFYSEERLNKIYEWIEYTKNKYKK